MRGTVRVYTLHIYGITHEGYGQGSYVPYIGDMHVSVVVRVHTFHIYKICT